MREGVLDISTALLLLLLFLLLLLLLLPSLRNSNKHHSTTNQQHGDEVVFRFSALIYYIMSCSVTRYAVHSGKRDDARIVTERGAESL